jgi:hypothetical protein
LLVLKGTRSAQALPESVYENRLCLFIAAKMQHQKISGIAHQFLFCIQN